MHQEEYETPLLLERVVTSLSSNPEIKFIRKSGLKTLIEYSEIGSFLVDFYISPKNETYDIEELNSIMNRAVGEIKPFEFNPFSLFELSKRRFLRFGYVEFRDYPAYGKFEHLEEITIRDSSLIKEVEEKRKAHFGMFQRRLEKKEEGKYIKTIVEESEIRAFLRKIRLSFYPSERIADLSFNGNLNPSSMIEMNNRAFHMDLSS